MKRDFLSLLECSRGELEALLDLAARLKQDLKTGCSQPLLSGKALAMIFEKPSLRTRVTFEVGMSQLQGHAVYLAPEDIRLGERESVADVARNLCRWVDGVMARTFAHSTLQELSRYASVPVINGLSNLFHPCQILSDCLTLLERFGRLETLRVAFIGDANNVANSWMNGAARLGFEFALACPLGYDPHPAVLEAARAAGGKISVTHDPAEAAAGAHVLYADVWTSMGQEAEAEQRQRDFARYRIDSALVGMARPDAVVMHCLPAHRGEEITAEVIDGPHSIVFDQAENRLHAQKAVLVWLLTEAGAAPR
jgi:ornithine carbamoyltransferase